MSKKYLKNFSEFSTNELFGRKKGYEKEQLKRQKNLNKESERERKKKLNISLDEKVLDFIKKNKDKLTVTKESEFKYLTNTTRYNMLSNWWTSIVATKPFDNPDSSVKVDVNGISSKDKKTLQNRKISQEIFDLLEEIYKNKQK